MGNKSCITGKIPYNISVTLSINTIDRTARSLPGGGISSWMRSMSNTALPENNARENALVISEKVSMSVSAVIEAHSQAGKLGDDPAAHTIIDQAKAGKDVTSFISSAWSTPSISNVSPISSATTRRSWSAITSPGTLTLYQSGHQPSTRPWSGCSN